MINMSNKIRIIIIMGFAIMIRMIGLINKIDFMRMIITFSMIKIMTTTMLMNMKSTTGMTTMMRMIKVVRIMLIMRMLNDQHCQETQYEEDEPYGVKLMRLVHMIKPATMMEMINTIIILDRV